MSECSYFFFAWPSHSSPAFYPSFIKIFGKNYGDVPLLKYASDKLGADMVDALLSRLTEEHREELLSKVRI